MGMRIASASQEARTAAEKCRSRAPRGAPAYVTGRSSLSVLGDGSACETDHQVRRSAPAPVGALLPSFALRATEGKPRR